MLVLLLDALLPPSQDHTPIGCHSFNRWPFVDHGCWTCPKAILSSFPRHRPVGSHFFNKCPVVDHCCLTQVFFHPKTTHQLVAILSASAHLSITAARQLSKSKLSSFPRPTNQLDGNHVFGKLPIADHLPLDDATSPPKTHKPSGCCRFVNKCPLPITAARPTPPHPHQCPGPHTNWRPSLSTGAPSPVLADLSKGNPLFVPQNHRPNGCRFSPGVPLSITTAARLAHKQCFRRPKTHQHSHAGEPRCSAGSAPILQGNHDAPLALQPSTGKGARWLEILDGRRRPGRHCSGPKSSKLLP